MSVSFLCLHLSQPYLSLCLQSDLIHLMKEQDYATSYLYKSVNNIRQLRSMSENDEVQDLFDRIQVILQEDMICSYRNILHVFGEGYASMENMAGVQLGRVRKRELTTLMHHTQMMITVRLLRQWMDLISEILDELEGKLQ